MSAPATPTPPPADPVLDALKLEQAQLDVRLKILQDQRAGMTALLPSSTAAPNSGAYTVSGTNPFPSLRLAYLQLVAIAAEIATKIVAKAKPPGPVLIYDQAEINGVLNYNAVKKVLNDAQSQIQNLKQHFSSDIDPKAQGLLTLPAPRLPAANVVGPAGLAPAGFAPMLIPGLALAGLKTASDLIGMFRTNTTVAYNNPAVDDAALNAAVAGQLVAKGATVYLPAVVPVSLTDTASGFMALLSQMQVDLTTLQYEAGLVQGRLQQVSDALGAYMTADQDSQANQDSIDVETDPNQLPALKAKQAGLDRARDAARLSVLVQMASPAAALDAVSAVGLKATRDRCLKELASFIALTTSVVTAFGALQTSLTAISGTGTSVVTGLLRAEKLAAIAETTDASILLLKTSVLGGSVVTRTNLFKGGQLLFTGGAIASFMHFDAKTGKVLGSGLEAGQATPEKMTF